MKPSTRSLNGDRWVSPPWGGPAAHSPRLQQGSSCSPFKYVTPPALCIRLCFKQLEMWNTGFVFWDNPRSESRVSRRASACLWEGKASLTHASCPLGPASAQSLLHARAWWTEAAFAPLWWTQPVERPRHGRCEPAVIARLTPLSCLICGLFYLLCAEMNTYLHIKSQKCFMPAWAEYEKHTYFPVAWDRDEHFPDGVTSHGCWSFWYENTEIIFINFLE